MSESQTQQDTPSQFSQLVIMIATSALQQLGMMPDPSGKPGDVHLEGAQGMIDVLEMLSEKTKGNLDAAETKMLGESLTMLRLHFVEVAQAQKGNPTPPAAEPAATPPPAPPTEEAPAASAESKTRYRKSYG
jgi:hypothetical protein